MGRILTRIWWWSSEVGTMVSTFLTLALNQFAFADLCWKLG